MKKRMDDLTQVTWMMLKLAQEANVLALDVALDAAKSSSNQERLLKTAEEIKRLADQAIEIKELLVSRMAEHRP